MILLSRVSGPGSKAAVARSWSMWLLGHAVSIVAVVSIAGALAAFVRDALFGGVFGVSGESDAYFAAFVIMNTVVLVLAAGSLSAAVPPLLGGRVAHEALDRQEAVGAVLTLSIIPLGAAMLAILIGAPAMVGALAPGLPAVQTEQSVVLLRIFAPAVLLGGLAVVGARVLQFEERFLPAGLVGLVAALPAVLVLTLALWGALPPSTQVVALSVTAGGALQVAALVVALRGTVSRPSSSAIRAIIPHICRLLGPLLVYSSLTYATTLWERSVASNLGPGKIAEFTYATRVFTLALTFYITPLTSVFYPRYSNLRERATRSASSSYLNRWLQVAMVLGGLTAALYAGAGYHLIGFAYGRGQFDSQAIGATNDILHVFAAGAIPTAISALLHAACFASGIAWVVALAAALDLLLYMPLAMLLSNVGGTIGLAAARLVSFWLVLLVVAAVAHNRLQLSLKPFLTGVIVCSGAAIIAAMASVPINGLVSALELATFPALLMSGVGIAIVYCATVIPAAVLFRAHVGALRVLRAAAAAQIAATPSGR